jgi:hypothetical protein
MGGLYREPARGETRLHNVHFNADLIDAMERKLAVKNHSPMYK